MNYELLEELADLEHRRWSHWQAWCHKVLREHCPSEAMEKVLARWDKQIATEYKDLSEREKEMDRVEARKGLEIIARHTPKPKDEGGLIGDIVAVMADNKKHGDKDYEAQIWQIQAMIDRHPIPTTPTSQEPLEDLARRKGVECLVISFVPHIITSVFTKDGEQVKCDGTKEARLWLEKLSDKPESLPTERGQK